MPESPLLLLAVFRKPDGVLRTVGTASNELRLNPELDAEVSLVAQARLAKLSPAFHAELEATAHFTETLDRMTADIAAGGQAPDNVGSLAERLAAPEPGKFYEGDVCSICGQAIWLWNEVWVHRGPERPAHAAVRTSSRPG